MTLSSGMGPARRPSPGRAGSTLVETRPPDSSAHVAIVVKVRAQSRSSSWLGCGRVQNTEPVGQQPLAVVHPGTVLLQDDVGVGVGADASGDVRTHEEDCLGPPGDPDALVLCLPVAGDDLGFADRGGHVLGPHEHPELCGQQVGPQRVGLVVEDAVSVDGGPRQLDVAVEQPRLGQPARLLRGEPPGPLSDPQVRGLLRRVEDRPLGDHPRPRVRGALAEVQVGQPAGAGHQVRCHCIGEGHDTQP
jgi:hypothetical protein